MLETILASTVISTLISSVITYINFQKENQLKYITQQRKEWRDKLREIAYDLYGANLQDTFKLLTELKVRINIYGYGKGDEEDVSQDSHIWKLIADIEQLEKEKNIDMSPKLKCYQNQMIEYISLLLKADWERSKREVNGSRKYELYSIIIVTVETIVIAILVFCHAGLIEKYQELNIPIIIEIGIGTIFILLLLISFLLIRNIYGMEKWHKREKQKADDVQTKYIEGGEHYAETVKNIKGKY